ncbi:ABC transporter substrate-binding protein [Taibaiella soli]|uniref:Leucine-binding protein domain-containing protein n=1 Tax=Taibaiella soli TaxID=1649169 RepID=A0A2W2C3T0_9BACT|nr:ABC transporter substrate-binding protein [Taibaiella soli]PZF74773.1 hypothetical protein DN068_00835 [Taibaiella soli]
MNKKKYFLFTILILILACAPKAQAQFWKNWFKKEQPKKKPVKKAPPKAAPTAAKPVKKNQADYPPSKIKARYRIDVLAPLYLDELVKNNKPTFKGKLPDKAAVGVNFYEGLQLAADTLDKNFYKIDVFVHDITAIGETPQQLISSKKLDSTDLIIGCVPTNDVSVLAAFALKHQINFISALSPSDAGVKENPYFTLLQPSLQTNCEWIRKAAFKKHSGKKFFVYNRSSVSVDETAYKYIVDDEEKKFQKINVSTLPTKAALAAQFDSTELNVIVMPILDNAYAETLLTQLYQYFPRYNFEVFGMPTWRSLNSLKKADAYPNVAVYYTTPYYFDYSTQSGQAVANRYQHDFGGRPNEYVYRGYEIFNWYAYLLMKYGTIFNTHMGDNNAAPFTRYDIKLQWDSEKNLLYNENQHLYMYRYQSGSYMIEQ